MIIQAIYFCIAFILTVIIGKMIIPILKKFKVGQIVRNDGPRSHLRKQGTPTMGGIIIIISMILVSLLYCYINKFSSINEILPILLASIGFGIIGFIDDFKKLILKNTDGLSPRLKMFGLLIIATTYVLYLTKIKNIGTDIVIPFSKIYITLPKVLYILFAIFVMLGTTNAVNLNDGIDGLCATGLAIITGGLSVITFKINNIDVSVFSAIVSGSCAGFLIYNVYKAKVFMGDTGSLLLGGVISSIALYIKNPFLLVIIAIIPVAETLSVILQVLYFRKTGKRLFKMAPLHHHFELSRLERK